MLFPKFLKMVHARSNPWKCITCNFALTTNKLLSTDIALSKAIRNIMTWIKFCRGWWLSSWLQHNMVWNAQKCSNFETSGKLEVVQVEERMSLGEIVVVVVNTIAAMMMESKQHLFESICMKRAWSASIHNFTIMSLLLNQTRTTNNANDNTEFSLAKPEKNTLDAATKWCWRVYVY